MKKRDLKINLIIVLTLLYSLLNLFYNINATLNTIAWIVIVFITLLLTRNTYNRLVNDYKKTFIIILTLFIINLAYFFLGFIFGYSYNSSYGNILSNIFNFIFLIVIQEYMRALFLSYNSKNHTRYIIFITFIFIISELSIINIDATRNYINIFVIYIPLIVKHFLLSFITIKIGYHNSIVYRVINVIVSVFLPILPNVIWLVNGVYLILMPVIVYITLSYAINKAENKISLKEIKKENPISYVPYFIVITLAMIFVTGGFSYKITSVISPSMYPYINVGDAVITKTPSKKEIKEGDVIKFLNGDRYYIHRVFKIQRDNNRIVYITKGDNNNTIDDKLTEFDDIQGKVIYKIKYIGYPAYWLSKLFYK